MNPNPPPAPDPARAKYFLLQALRLSGAGLAFAGAAVIGHHLPLPEAVGYALVLAGAVEATIVPVLLARAWKRAKP